MCILQLKSFLLVVFLFPQEFEYDCGVMPILELFIKLIMRIGEFYIYIKLYKAVYKISSSNFVGLKLKPKAAQSLLFDDFAKHVYYCDTGLWAGEIFFAK